MRRLLVASTAVLLLTQTVLAAVFTDVSSDHPNYTAITALYERGVISGYPDNTFRPQQSVNRAEALKILLLGSNIFVPEIQPQEIFPDVTYDTWYGKYTLKAKDLGIVKGDGTTGLFRPGDTVNLAEALKMLLKTNQINAPQPSSAPYADVPIDAWFSPYFEYARLAGLLDAPPNGTAHPALAVSRGALAELMYRLGESHVVIPDGKASYYGSAFHGRTTASGEIFDASAFTAAHLTYPFGTRLKVTNAENGQSVVVRVNDRGPYVSDPSRIIDLSKAAFEHISPLSRGIINVKLEPTNEPVTESPDDQPPEPQPQASCPEADTLALIPKDTFASITLDADIPNRLPASQVLSLTGAAPSATHVSAFLVDSAKKQTAFSAPVVNGRFRIEARLPGEGTFQLGLLPGDSGQSAVKEIRVLSDSCLRETESAQLPPVSGLQVSSEKGDTVFKWNKGDYRLFKLTVAQNSLKKTYFLSDLQDWRPIYKEFASFGAGATSVFIKGATFDGPSLIGNSSIVWSPPVSRTFTAAPHHEYLLNPNEVALVSLSTTATPQKNLIAVFRPKTAIRSTAAVITPDGQVKEIDLTGTSTPAPNTFGVSVFPANAGELTANFPVTAAGVHFLEVNNAEGLAVLNVPVFPSGSLPLIPSARDLSDQKPVDLGSDFASLKSKFLSLVNADRAALNLPPFHLDVNLNRLAQYRSDDMKTNGYFGHWDKNGQSANDLRLNYGIDMPVSENLAKDITLELAEYGLMRSAIHRSNLISDEWTRVGFGITKAADGGYLFVQLFAADPLNLDDLESLRDRLLAPINQNRSAPLSRVGQLDSLAQNWSQKMATDDFFAFTDSSGQSLVETVRAAGVNAALGTYIMGNSHLSDALDQLANNLQLRDSNWKQIGIGIAQDKLGIIKITLVYTE